LTEPAELSAFAPYITHRKSRCLVQFLIALRSNFESLRGSNLHRSTLPFVDDVVNELLTKEIRLAFQSQANIALRSQNILSPNISSEK